MKNLRFLFLVLMAIVGQGTWAIEPSECSHQNWTHKDVVDPTCETDGSRGYYLCNDCGARAFSLNFSNLLTDEDIILPGGHKMFFVRETNNCFVSIAEHWECSRCHKCYVDEERTSEIFDNCYSFKNGHQEGVDGKCTVCGQQVVLHKGENHVSFVSDQMEFVVFKYTAAEHKRLVAEINCGNDVFPEIMQWDDFLDYMGLSENPSSAKRKAKKRIEGQGEEYSSEASWIVENGETYALMFWCDGFGEFDADITLSAIDLVGEISRGENTVYIGAFPDDFSNSDEQSYGNPDNYNLFRFESPVTGDVTFSSQSDGYCYVALFDGDKQLVDFIEKSYDGSFELSHPMSRGEVYYLGIRQFYGDNIGRVPLNVAFTNVATYLEVGDNTIDIAANSIQPNRYGWFNGDDAFQYFLFEAPCDGNLTVEDVTGTPGQQLAMYVIETGNVSSDDVPTSMYVPDVTKGTTYRIGLREYNGNALQDVKIRIGIECLNHNFNEDGICQNDGCTKQIRVLTEGLNEDVDCSYLSDRYLFIPETSGKLRISAKNGDDENVNLVYSLYDEEGTLVYTNYVASAPMHKVAKHSPGNGCIVEAHNKYLFDLSNNYGGEYDITINVSNGPDEIDGCFEISYYDDGELVEDNLSNTCEDIYQQAGLGSYDGTSSFIALNGVYYERKSTTSRWGTVVLPFELRSNDDVTYYVLSEVSGENMTFSPVETVPANNPAVYRFNCEADNYQYCISTTDPTRIDIPEQPYVNCETDVDGWSMVGFYKVEEINSEYYDDYESMLASIRYISKDKFMTATNSLTIKPYRSIFQYVGENPSMAKTFTISINDEADGIEAIVTEDGIEEIEAIYDLNGRKLDNMKSGVNIVRIADGKVHKIIKK